MRFSQRNGHSAIRTAIQLESIDQPLKNSLWNALQTFVWDAYSRDGVNAISARSGLNSLLKSLWIDFYRVPADTIPYSTNDAIAAIRKNFFETEWFNIYDFVEFTIPRLQYKKVEFIERCNNVLEREVAGYRIIAEKVCPITSTVEIQTIETALLHADPAFGARTHIQRALDLLSSKPTPDYRNSIKESISAVESIAKKLTDAPSDTLGAALSKISRQHPIPPSLKNAFKTLYGYTSDADGIRHALIEQPNSTFSEAKFMLVACSAFVNYLLECSLDSRHPQA